MQKLKSLSILYTFNIYLFYCTQKEVTTLNIAKYEIVYTFLNTNKKHKNIFFCIQQQSLNQST